MKYILLIILVLILNSCIDKGLHKQQLNKPLKTKTIKLNSKGLISKY